MFHSSYCIYLYLLGGLHFPVFQRLASAFVYIFWTEMCFSGARLDDIPGQKLDRLLLVVYVQTGMFDLGFKCSRFQ